MSKKKKTSLRAYCVSKVKFSQLREKITLKNKCNDCMLRISQCIYANKPNLVIYKGHRAV